VVPGADRSVSSSTVRECGTCSQCCEIPAVPAIKKPANHRCPFYSKGCSIYPDHPGQCKTFVCLWLGNDRLPDRMRPDRCGVTFEPLWQEKTVLALVDPFRPNAWDLPPAKGLLRRMVRDGYTVWVLVGKEKRLFLPEGMTESMARRGIEHAWKRNNGDIRH
jgi:hypothetical protein